MSTGLCDSGCGPRVTEIEWADGTVMFCCMACTPAKDALGLVRMRDCRWDDQAEEASR